MPIAFEGQLYKDSYDLEMNRPIEAPGEPLLRGGMGVPGQENNAPAGNVVAKKGIVNIDDVPHHDWVETVAKEIAKGIASGFTLPGDVMAGKASDEDVGRVLDLTGLAMMAPGAKTPTGEVHPAVNDLQKSISEYENFVKSKKILEEPSVEEMSNNLIQNIKKLEKPAANPDFEQVPIHFSDKEWKTFSQEQKNAILNNYSDEIPYKKPASETGVYDKYIDMYVKQPVLKNAEKLPKDISPVEAFMRGVEDTHEQLKTSLVNIKNKYTKAFDKDFPEEIPGPAISAVKDYTEPAYRGLTVYGKDATPSSVHDFTRAPEMYSTSSPMLADMYAGYLDSHPGFKVPQGAFKPGSQVAPLMINTKDYHYYDAAGKEWTQANRLAVKEAQEAGKKGVIVDNVWDEPNSTKALRTPKKIFITLPEGASTVKSRFAKDFNPNSSDMLHSIAAIGVGGTAGYIAMENHE